MKKVVVLAMVLLISFALIGCGRASLDVEDGTYNGFGDGYKGEIEVEVTVEDGDIVSVEILDHSETEGTSDDAIDGIPEQVVEAQNYDLDIVSGATGSSEGIMEAVENALEGA